jgi:hypothetical protein
MPGRLCVGKNEAGDAVANKVRLWDGRLEKKYRVTQTRHARCGAGERDARLGRACARKRARGGWSASVGRMRASWGSRERKYERERWQVGPTVVLFILAWEQAAQETRR